LTYTPGHSERSVSFMAARSVEEHYAFALPHLRPGMALLDCGCGPGTLTAQLASAVAPGHAVGVDASGAQFALGLDAARAAGVESLELVEAELPPLPFPDTSFDVVTAHALFEHLVDPAAALGEVRRVLRPEGVAAICAVDWGGFLVSPEDELIRQALRNYEELMRANGSTPRFGRRLASELERAGLAPVEVGARYECHRDLRRVADYFAGTLERSGFNDSADALRVWGGKAALFAQAWVWVVARPRS
jgi:ubiquinone/menaquinone biosynthesis C-methylase UbiE